MGTHILFRRGNFSELPEKAPSGMPLWCTDKKSLYIGTGDSVSKIAFDIPVGTIILKSSNRVPEGFLVCNGGAISRTVYKNLFDEIGTLFGSGDGLTTFNLPNLTTSNYRYIKTGTNVGSKIDASIISHSHSFSGIADNVSLIGDFRYGAINGNEIQANGICSKGASCDGGDGDWDNSISNNYIQINASHSHTIQGSIGTTGSNSMEVNSLILLPCIKY